MNHIPDMSRIAGGCVATGTFPSLYPEKLAVLRALRETGNQPSRDFSQPIFIPNLLFPKACEDLRAYYESQGTFAPVTIQGMAPGAELTALGGQPGSNRITCWDPAFGENLWALLQPFLPKERRMNDLCFTDWHQADSEGNGPVRHRNWKPVGVSPMARYMRYDKGGQHFAHYDAGYIYPGGFRRTLMSGVLYLTTNSTGATQFIADGQQDKSVWDLNLLDWERPVKPAEVLTQFTPQIGSVLLFDHRLCHAVAPYDGAEGARIIIRFDVIFEAC